MAPGATRKSRPILVAAQAFPQKLNIVLFQAEEANS
jgi:hypothetical protein